MGFRLLILTEGTLDYKRGNSYIDDLPRMVAERLPDVQVDTRHAIAEALDVIVEADAALGNIVPELFDRAQRLRWIASPQAGPAAGYYHRALIDSDVVVTNVRGIYNDHIGAHIMAFVLAFARGLHVYVPQQLQRVWRPTNRSVHLPDSTAVIVGVGGIGGEAARLCSQFGMKVIGLDARLSDPPAGVSELHPPNALPAVPAIGRLRHRHRSRNA